MVGKVGVLGTLLLLSTGCDPDPSSVSSVSGLSRPELLAADRNWQGLLMMSMGEDRGSDEVQATVLLWETNLPTSAKFFGAQLGDLDEPIEEPPKWLGDLKNKRQDAREAVLTEARAALDGRFDEICPDMRDADEGLSVLWQARSLKKMDDRARVLDLSPKSAALRPALKTIFEAESEVARLEIPPAKPEPKVSSRPTYSKPEYTGSYYLSGRYKGPFSGSGWSGIMLSRGDTLYVIKHGAKPLGFTDRLTGYVEPSYPRTIWVTGVGRRERQANLVELVDRLDFKEDKAKHRTQVSQAKLAHRARQAEYSQSQREHRTALSQWKKDKAGRSKELKTAKAAFVDAADAVRTETLKQCGDGAP